MREYETTVIVQPEISDEGSAAIFGKLDGIFEKHGAIRLLNDNLGKRKLAYEIRKFHKGHYYILSFLSDGKVVPELERSLRLDESILRFMTVQVNDEVVDIEARRAEAKEAEIEQERRAAERAAREAEEAKARAEIEREAEAAAAAAEEAAAASGEDSLDPDSETSKPEPFEDEAAPDDDESVVADETPESAEAEETKS